MINVQVVDFLGLMPRFQRACRDNGRAHLIFPSAATAPTAGEPIRRVGVASGSSVFACTAFAASDVLSFVPETADAAECLFTMLVGGLLIGAAPIDLMYAT